MFWDSSALIPLLLLQPGTPLVQPLSPAERVVWWGARTECISALCRLRREGHVRGELFEALREQLDELIDEAIEVQPAEAVRDRADRLLMQHPLRAADSFQLAAALVFCEERPRGTGFVCFDNRLREAARIEGFNVVPILRT